MIRRLSKLNRARILAGSIAPLLMAPALALGYNSTSSTFTLIAVPDPQYYSLVQWKNDQYYADQMNWIVQNKDTMNIAFVYGLGDNVQDGNPFGSNADGSINTAVKSGNILGPESAGNPAQDSAGHPSITVVDPVNSDYEAEWKRASADWDILGNANVPYYTVAGNHDYFHWDQKKNPNEFLKYFGPARYAGKSWFGGSSPIDTTQPANLQYAGLNTYTYFFAGGYKFLNIGLQFEGQTPETGDLTWAQSIMNMPANKGLPTIISTHDYQDDNGRDAAGNFIWNGLVKGNSQIFMVLSGHVNGTHEQTSNDTAGQPVLEMLSDYQDFAFPGLQNGGGYLRTLSVDTATNSIHVQTYSTVANSFLTTGTGAAANDFTLNFNFAQRFGAPPFLTGKSFFWDPTKLNTSAGGGPGTWDGATSTNWFNGTADGAWSASTNTDAAMFGGAAGAVTVAAAGVSVNDMVFKSAGYTLSGGPIAMIGTPSIDTTAGAAIVNNVLTGNAGLTLTGGPIILGGANTFTGGLTVSGGANLTFTADNNLGAAAQPVTIDGGTLTYTGNVTNGLTETRAFAIGSNGATINVPNPGLSNGKLVINGASLLSGAGDITKIGQGWLTVYNNNSGYGGDWNVNGGVLEVGGANALGTGNIIVNNGGEVGNNITGALANPITINAGGTIGADYFNVSSAGTYSGPITTTGNFNVRLGNFYSGQSQKVIISGSISGSGTLSAIGPVGTVVNPSASVLSLTGDNSSFTGGVTVITGTVAVGATAGKPLGTGTVTLSGGKLALQGQAVQTGAVGTLNPVNVSGFNKDVIYATPDVGGTTTVGLDNVFSFYQNLYVPPAGTLNAGAELTGGLTSPSITSTLANSVYQAKGQTVNTPFTLQSFTANNALQFAQGNTGTLSLNVPGAYGNIAILATSTFSNEDTPNVTIHFTDGTTAITTYKAYDWSMGTDSLRLAASVLGPAGIERYSPTQTPGWDQRPFGLYETDIDLTNINGVDDSFKQIASITFDATSSDAQSRGKTNIFAISGAPRGWVTGTSQNYSNPVVVTADSGIDISGSLGVTMSSLSIGANKLSVASSDTTSSPYSLSFASGTLSGGLATIDVATSSGGGAGKVILGATGGLGSLNKTNSGTLELTGINTYSGSTTLTTGVLTLDAAASLASPTVTIGSGTTFNANGTLASNTTFNANGTVILGANPNTGILTRTITALNLTSTGTVNILPTAVKTNRTVLVINGDGTHSGLTFSGGKLDVSNNDMIVKNANFSDLSSQLKAGFNAGIGYWNGNSGIISSTAAADNRFLTTIGYRPGGILFDGNTTTTTSDALIKYTYYGDADLSGTLDGADYQQIDNGFGNALTGWFNGDFNYDGVVNGSDFALIDNTFNQLTATSAQSLALIGSPADLTSSSTPNASPTSFTAVPEPTMLGLLGLGGISVLRRRRSS